MQISGRTAVVTGGAAGIGRAASVALATRGAAKLVLVDVDCDGLAETARLVEAAKTAVETHVVDLADLAGLEAWLTGLPPYDILFNNAGIVAGVPQFPDTDAARVQTMVDINLTAVIVATQVAVRAMAARGGGVVINTVSTVVLGTGFSDVLYAATKAGAMMFTQSCASLKASHNVRVAGVLPGLTDTPILKKTGGDGEYAPWMAPILAGNAMCTPEDIAAAVVDLIEDDTLPGGAWVAVRKVDGAVVREWGGR